MTRPLLRLALSAATLSSAFALPVVSHAQVQPVPVQESAPDLRAPDLRAPDLRAPDLRAPDLRALNPDLSFDTRHQLCLETIADDPEAAFETAMTWVGRGGGFRARHCEAMALFALGQEAEAGYRLDTLVAEFPDIPPDTSQDTSQDHANGSVGADIDEMRVDYSVNAAQSWLQAGEPDRAYASATRALDIEPADADARIVRARTYFALDRVEDAETDLSNLLAYHPGHAEGLRFRADARLRLGKLDAALEDAEDSLALQTSVDTALVRGHILEAIRKQDTPQKEPPQ